MPQHDMVIDNGSGATVRADINNALAALVANNSGATAPSTTYAYMFWADTTAGYMKQRNGANTAWITLWPLATGFGTAAFAAIGTSGDTVPKNNTSNTFSAAQVGSWGSAGNTITPWRAHHAEGTNPASHVRIQIDAGATGGGDPWLEWNVLGGGLAWSLGIDNSDSDALILSKAAGLGTPIARFLNGMTLGSPTGGDQGSGTLNLAGGVYVNGVLVGGGLVPIERKTSSAVASYDFLTGIDGTYRTYKLIGWLRPATDDVELWTRLSDDGSTFEADASDYSYQLSSWDHSGTARFANSTGDTKMRWCTGDASLAVGNAADERIVFEVTIHDLSTTGVSHPLRMAHSYIAATGAIVTGTGSGRLVATDDILGIQLLFESGNIAAGDVTLYGVKNA